MSLGSSSPKHSLDRTCNTGKAEEPCNVTDDNLGPDCYESMHAFKKIRTSTSGLRKSPNKWTKEENQKLASLVASYGEKKWKRISAEMGGQKTGAQCAQHWKRVLSPEIRKGHWDENEEDLLLRLVVQYGSCWKKIAKKIPQRTDIQCRYQYLKAKQSREVLWDAKEDESLIKKVMEMANCNFFHIISENNTTINSTSNNANITSNARCNSPPLTNHTSTSMTNHSPIKVSGIKQEDSEMKSSGEYSKDGAWNDDKYNVNMSDSSINGATASPGGGSKATFPIDGADRQPCSNCNSPAAGHVNKVVWLEISEHMARLKLTSTLRTALECKTRFEELLGNKISFSAPNNFCLNNNTSESSCDSSKHQGLKNGGSIGVGGSGVDGNDNLGFHNAANDTNINIKFNNSNTKTTATTSSGNNNINITNCNNNNITINITNSYTTTTNSSPNGSNFPRISHCTNSPPNPTPMKTEHSSPVMGQSLLPKSSVPTILSPAPPFPPFSHLSHPSFPPVPQSTALKPARSVPSGLESLAAVASILPREMMLNSDVL